MQSRVFHPPPSWPVDFDGPPPPGWTPDPAWGPPPLGWALWVYPTRWGEPARLAMFLLVVAVIGAVAVLIVLSWGNPANSGPVPAITPGSFSSPGVGGS